MQDSVILRLVILYIIFKKNNIELSHVKLRACLMYFTYLRCLQYSTHDCTTIGAIFTAHLETVQKYAEFQMAAQSENDPQHGFLSFYFFPLRFNINYFMSNLLETMSNGIYLWKKCHTYIS